MKKISANLTASLLISFLLVLPFVLMEWINRRIFQEDFPFFLFGLLWFLLAAFLILLMPLLRNIRSVNHPRRNLLSLLIKVPVLLFIAWMWIGIILDQMPCFLGVANCD